MRRSRFPDSRWQARACSPDGWVGVATEGAAEDEALTLKFGFDLMEVVESAKAFLPLGLEPFVLQADFQYSLKAKSQERTEHITADRLSAFV